MRWRGSKSVNLGEIEGPGTSMAWPRSWTCSRPTARDFFDPYEERRGTEEDDDNFALDCWIRPADVEGIDDKDYNDGGVGS